MSPPAAAESTPHFSVWLVKGVTQTLPLNPTLAVRSPPLLTIVNDVAAVDELLATNAPFVTGVVWSAPVTVITPISTFIAVVQDTVAVCDPEGGLITWKIIVRIAALAPESVPGTRVAAIPPRLAWMLVAVFAAIVTMIIAARFEPVPTTKAGVFAEVTPHWKPEFTLLSNATPGRLVVSDTVVVCVSVPLMPVMVSVDAPVGVVVLVVIVSVDDALVGFGENAALAPVGSPLAVSVTALENPAIALMLTVYVVDPPCVTVRLDGEPLRVKSGVDTTRDTLAVCVRDPLTPVIVNAYVPLGVVVLVVTERLEEAVAGLGVNAPLAPAGNPLTLKATWPVKPLTGVIVTP
jgi:hypothetical protein